MSNVINLPPNKKSGLYKGKLHVDGGIQSIVDSRKLVEIETDEYHFCKSGINSDEVYEFKNKTNKEVLDILFKEEACTFTQGKSDSGDFILCRLVVLDNKPHGRSGTVKDILNQMQSEKSCRVSYDYSPDETKRKLGGSVNSKLEQEANALRYSISLLEKKLIDNPNDTQIEEGIELLKETLADLNSEIWTMPAWFKFEKEDAFKRGYLKTTWSEKSHVSVPMKGTFLDAYKNEIKTIPYYKVQELMKDGWLLTEKEYKDYTGEKEFEIKYISKDRLRLSKKMRGSVRTWVTAKNREGAEKKIKNKKEFPDFGELVSIKATGLKFEMGGNTGGDNKGEIKVNMSNIDLSAFFFSDKRGGLIYPKIETVYVGNYHMPLKSTLLFFSNENKKHNDFISMDEIIGAVIPDIDYVKDIAVKNHIPFVVYSTIGNGDGKIEKFDAIKKLAKTHAEIIVD